MVSDTLSAKLQEIMTETGVFVPFIIHGVFLMENCNPFRKENKQYRSSALIFRLRHEDQKEERGYVVFVLPISRDGLQLYVATVVETLVEIIVSALYVYVQPIG
jgi:hypothetical protein